jgi:gentisate 1,2-dioxygenase
MSNQADVAGADRQKFYGEIGPHHLAPLWERLHALVPKSPSTPIIPVKWDYDAVVRQYVFRAGEIVTAAEAERRVLILENPGLPGNACVTHSLYAGLQLVKPGEIARAHRHTQSALRFVMEGSGAYTAVDGERVEMHPGDLVLTPSWRWHDHGNESSQPMVWLDGLDIPILGFFDAGFAEASQLTSQAKARPIGDSAARFSSNMFPVDWRPSDKASPILRYPYEGSAEALAGMARGADPDPCHGHKLRFINPATGGAPMPTIAAFMQLLPTGFSSAPYRSTDGTVFVVVEGEGESEIGGEVVNWKARDIFVVPSWFRVVHRARAETTLFSFSDRAVQETLGLWREDREVEGNTR